MLVEVFRKRNSLPELWKGVLRVLGIINLVRAFLFLREPNLASTRQDQYGLRCTLARFILVMHIIGRWHNLQASPCRAIAYSQKSPAVPLRGSKCDCRPSLTVLQLAAAALGE